MNLGGGTMGWTLSLIARLYSLLFSVVTRMMMKRDDDDDGEDDDDNEDHDDGKAQSLSVP